MSKKKILRTSREVISELFDCILVINLSHRYDRRREMEHELNKVGLNFADGSAQLLVASQFNEDGGFATIGARGCFDSHLRALKTAVACGAKNVLILEDDCDFSDRINHNLEESLRTLSGKDWSIFYGGHLSQLEPPAVEGGVFPISPDIALVGAHFIGISGKVIPSLVDYLKDMVEREPGSTLGGPMHVDGAYSWFRREHPHLQTWVAEPRLGFQRSSRTDVHDLRFFDRVPVLRQLVQVVRRLKRILKI